MFQMTHSANLVPLGCKFKAILGLNLVFMAFSGKPPKFEAFSSLCEPSEISHTCTNSQKYQTHVQLTIPGVPPEEPPDWLGSFDSLPHEHFTCWSAIVVPFTEQIA